MDRGHGGPNDPNTQGTSSATDPRRRSKRPRTERARIPTIPTRPSERDRQRSTQTPTRQQTVCPARPRPPSQGRRLARYRGDSTPGTHGQGDPRPTNGPNRGWREERLKAPPRKQGATTPAADTGTGHPTNWAHTPRGSPPWLQRSPSAGARRTHRDNGGRTRAARERTKK